MLKNWLQLDFWESKEWKELEPLLPAHADGKEWAPKNTDIFRALVLTPLNRVKVVILGQDPYHTPGVADGLAFSTRGCGLPRTLRNIVSELRSDLTLTGNPKSGSLESWAKQGVLLLNTSLTVQVGIPGSHENLGWDSLIEEILWAVSERNSGTVFILWGKHAQKIAADACISNNFTTIESSHPSPLSADKGFFGSRPFSRTNSYLREIEQREIQWILPGMH